MNRRSFLKGAAVVAAVPLAAKIPEVVERAGGERGHSSTFAQINQWHEREHRHAREASELRAVVKAVEEKYGLKLS